MNEIKNIGIVTALQEEFEELKNTLNVDVEPIQDDTDVLIIYKAKFKTKYKTELQLIFLLINDQCNTASSAATTWFLNKYDFHILINIGIAGLLSKDNHLLDVIICDECYQYDYRIKTKDNKEKNNYFIEYAGKHFSAIKQFSEILSQLRNISPSVYNDWVNTSKYELSENLNADIMNRLKEIKLLNDVQVIDKGLLASGGTVGSSECFKEFILTQNRLEKH